MTDIRTATLGELTLNFDAKRKPIKSTERVAGPFPYYGASSIVDHVEDYIFDGEYLLIAEDGENLRSRKTPIAFIANGRFWVNNHAHVVQGNELADTRYLSYLLSKTDLSGYITGSTQPKLTRKALDSVRLRIPVLPVQQAIADVLSSLDDKIAANTKLANTADRLAGHIFDQAVAFVPKISMSQVLNPILGGTPTRANPEFWDGVGLWASAKDVTGALFGVISATEEKITQQAIARTKAKPLPAGSVILTARGTVGAVARLAVPSSFNQSCYGFTPERIAPGLLYFSILRAAQQARALAHGSVFDTITKRTFDHLQIPDFGEAGMSVEAQIAPLLDLVTASVMENASLAATRDALLPQLMSGKLRIRDAESLVESVV